MLREVNMKQYFDLKGRVAIVTGCSGGLGVQMAKALANQGAIIVPIARRQQKIEEVAAEIREEFGVETFPVRSILQIHRWSRKWLTRFWKNMEGLIS
jgi:NADP-dependent 3-hydroxy acid dehydrogenase YdfG